jgi:hypothetical protein
MHSLHGFAVAAFLDQGSSTSMEAHSRVLEWGRPSNVYRTCDLRGMRKLCEVVKEYLRGEVRNFLRRHESEGVMVQYGSGCTPLMTRSRYRYTVGNIRVQRSGRATHEWLVQRAFLLSGRGHRMAALAEPCILLNKTGWVHFAAYRAFMPLPREVGMRGLILHHHIYDRAIWGALSRYQRQLHVAKHEQERLQRDEGDAHLSSLLSFFTSVPCVNHDVHSSLRWATGQLFDDPNTARAMFLNVCVGYTNIWGREFTWEAVGLVYSYACSMYSVWWDGIEARLHN